MSGPLLIHGLVESDAPVPMGAPAHRRVAVPGSPELAALVSVLQVTADGTADTAEALRHHEILAAYAAVTDVAPVRFGAVAADEVAASNLLGQHADAHAAALDRVAGCVEFAARLTTCAAAAPDPEPPAQTGRSYLQARLSNRQRREAAQAAQAALVARVSTALAEHARESFALPPRPARGEQPPRVLDLALLVPRGAIEYLVAEARALDDEAADSGLMLTLSGPWPAYSFVTPERAEDAA